MPRMSEPAAVTALLRAWSGGDEAALGALLPLVEGELRRLARAYMARERKGHTLQATALVNEAFLRREFARDRPGPAASSAPRCRENAPDPATPPAGHQSDAGTLR